MKTAEVIALYGGTQDGVARALGLRQPSVCNWGEYPPPLRQIQIERMTCGALKAEPWCWDAKAAPDKAAA